MKKLLLFGCLLSYSASCLAMELTEKFEKTSSIWAALAVGTKLTREQKWDCFVKDCAVLNKQKQFMVPQKSSKVLRVGIYNTHCLVDPYSNKNRDSAANIAGLVTKSEVDVWGLQEVPGIKNGSFNRGHNADFHFDKALQDGGYNLLPVITWSLYNGLGNMFCAKKNISVANTTQKLFATNFVKPNDDGEKRGFVGGHFVWNGKKVAFYSLHLDVWDQTGKTRESQVKELLEFIRSEQKKYPDTTFIVGGDFNAVRKQDHDYTVSGKNVWKLLVADDLERKVKTPQSVAALFDTEKKWLGNVYDELPDQAPTFTSCFGKVIDFVYYTKNTGLKPVAVYADYGTVTSEKIDPKTLEKQGKYLTTPSDHVPVVVDFEAVDTAGSKQFAEKLAQCKKPLDIGDNRIKRLFLLDSLKKDFEKLTPMDQELYKTEYTNVINQDWKNSEII